MGAGFAFRSSVFEGMYAAAGGDGMGVVCEVNCDCCEFGVLELEDVVLEFDDEA